MKKIRNFFNVVLSICLIAPVALSAADTSFKAPSATDKGDTIVESVSTLSTILYSILQQAIGIVRMGSTFIAFIFGVLGYFMGANYVKKKAEQNNGQEAPSIIRLGVPIVGALGGVVIVFIIVGIFGKVFLGLTVSEAWDWAVKSVLRTSSGIDGAGQP